MDNATSRNGNLPIPPFPVVNYSQIPIDYSQILANKPNETAVLGQGYANQQPENATSSSVDNKKCMYHRQCSRNHAHPYQPQHTNQNQASNRPRDSAASNAAASDATNKGHQRDAISTNASAPMNATVISDRYLLLEVVEGSTLYRAVDIQTHDHLVCKVSAWSNNDQ
jgi:hypothetical protein